MGDDQLLRQARDGDRRALDELCHREWRPVYALLYHGVRDRAEAQDLTQEVFLRALRSLDRYREGAAPFGAYLATIARNLLRDRWRRKALGFVDLDQLDYVDNAARAAGGEADPLERLLADAEHDRLCRALAALPADYQTVIHLRIVEGRAGAEVARLMGRSPDAVRQLQHRALVALRAALCEESPR